MTAIALATVAACGACAAVILAAGAGAATASSSTARKPLAPALSTPPVATASAAPATSVAVTPTSSLGGGAAKTPSGGTKPVTPAATRSALAPSQLPAFSGEQWESAGALSVRTVTGHTITENECADVPGATVWTQQGFSGGDGKNPAIEDAFDFPDAAAAQRAYARFTAAMADCQTTTRAYQSKNGVTPDAVVRQTAALPHALAWSRTWTGVEGMSAEGPQTNHVYVATAGSRLIVLQFTEFPGATAPYAISGDPQTLAMLAGKTA
ncbi:hypothetical protein [Actinospica robiniae]|uniref:hypothetical protein n=1 Tax=Actinospica robiniae TaxID=304901 RepID=UPI0003F5C079|nr:hypothetical protein [Actinospica robiniae]